MNKNKWVKEFLSDGIRHSKRDKVAHFPWRLEYNASELVSKRSGSKYKPIEIGGKELHNYCLKYYKRLNKMIDSILRIIFATGH